MSLYSSLFIGALTRISATRRVVPSISSGLSKGTRKRLHRESVLGLLALAVVLAIVVSVVLLRDLLDLSRIGYPAIAILSLLGSGGLVVPVPGMASVCAGGLLLSPVLVALVAGSAETVGELTGYTLGVSGRGLLALKRGRLYTRMEYWMRRRGWLVLFLLSLIPNPIFDLAGVAAGALRFPVWGFLGVIWPGKVIKFLIIAYACAYGMDSVFRFFGVNIG